MEVIPLKKKLKKEMLWSIKVIMPMKTYLKAYLYERKPN
jgi:hypothetical protein